jgi:hypothetical protein
MRFGHNQNMKCIDCIGRLQGLATIKTRKYVDCTGRLQKFFTILAAFDTCYETVQATLYATLWIPNIYVLCNFTHLFRLPQPSVGMPFLYYRGVLKYFIFFFYNKRNNRNIIQTNLENKKVVKPSLSVN